MPRVLIPESQRSPSLQWHHENRDHARERMTARRILHRDRLTVIKMLRGCADCGYNAHPQALDFDHRPGEVKSFTVSEVTARKWSTVLAEIAKCEVVCANCHRVRTAHRRELAA